MSGKKHPVTWQLEHLCVQCVIAHNYINGLKERGPYPSARGKARCLWRTSGWPDGWPRHELQPKFPPNSKAAMNKPDSDYLKEYNVRGRLKPLHKTFRKIYSANNFSSFTLHWRIRGFIWTTCFTGWATFNSDLKFLCKNELRAVIKLFLLSLQLFMFFYSCFLPPVIKCEQLHEVGENKFAR